MRKWSALIVAVSATAALLVGTAPPERDAAAPTTLAQGPSR